jgi:hypothetical protein
MKRVIYLTVLAALVSCNQMKSDKVPVDHVNEDTVRAESDVSQNVVDSVQLKPDSSALTENEEVKEEVKAPSRPLTRREALELFTGKFNIVHPGLMKDGITFVYELELDPVNSQCEWVIDDCVNIRNSKGFCGSFIKMEEAWNIYTFSLHNSLKYAIAKMRRVDEFYDGETQYCTVKLALDDFNNIQMSFVEGNAAPYPLYNFEMDKCTEVATFYRDKP